MCLFGIKTARLSSQDTELMLFIDILRCCGNAAFTFLARHVHDNCGVSVSHNSEGHEHQAHSHTTSAEHGQGKHEDTHAERKGISSIL